MAFNIPTLRELFAQALARLESAIGQTSPVNDKAFLRVLAAVESGLGIGLYKYAADRAKQNLGLTATGTDLDNIGNNYSTARRPAQVAIVQAELTAADGTVIPSTIDFIADANNLRYRATSPVTAAGGVADMALQCVVSGAIGTLEVGDTLQIAAQIVGAGTVATVTAINQIGVDRESDADYRPRVLFAQRAVTGGANATDHKIWSEEVHGVARAFPYSGRPADEGASFPGDRQVYIEATTDVDADGIAPAALLTAVRTNINTDPDTGLSRLPLGITDATLFMRSITRTTFFVEVRNLVVDPAKEGDCKTAIRAALQLYFLSIAPYVDGVDLPQERVDTISSMTVGIVVQDVLQSFGATSSSVGFGLAAGVFLTTYTLGIGELGKLGLPVAYA